MKAKKLEYDHQLGDQLGELHKPLYTLLIEQDNLEKIDLFEGQKVKVGTNEYTVEGRIVYRNGKTLERGKSTFDKEIVTLLVPEEDIFISYIFPPQRFICSKKESADISWKISNQLIFSNNQVQVTLGESPIYLNDRLVKEGGLYPFELGNRMKVSNYFIEKRKNQWKIGCLFEEPQLNRNQILIQEK